MLEIRILSGSGSSYLFFSFPVTLSFVASETCSFAGSHEVGLAIEKKAREIQTAAGNE